MNEQELRDGLAYVRACLQDMHTRADGRALTDDEQRAWDEGRAYVQATERTLRRYDEARALAAQPGHIEPGTAPQVVVKGDPFAAMQRRSDQGDGEYRRSLVDGALRAVEDLVEDGDNQAHFERTLKRHAGDTGWAREILGRARPEYGTGFGKLLMGRSELLNAEERAALQVGSNTAGGYLLPTHLDPTIILTNSGTSNVIRSMSRVVTLTQGITWNGVTSAGMTASWDGELAEVSDDSPTVGRVSIATNIAQAFVQASIAAADDITGLATDLMMLFADARDRLEGAAHATGLGSSNQPKGIVTALAASSGVVIQSTTAATIGEVDIHSVYRQVPIRWRGRANWLTNPLYSLAIKRLGTAVSSSFSGDLTTPVTDRVLGRPLVESDDMPTTQTTTALDNEVVFGDFSNYVVVDKPGSMSVEFIPHLFNTANNLPDGRRGWYAYWRTGADAVNLAAFRLLVDKTSA